MDDEFMIMIFLGFVSLMVPYAALSIPGDILYIQVDVANLRQGDSLKQPVITWLTRGHRIMETQRKGEWVEVVADWAKGKTGWIHSSIIDKNYVSGESHFPIAIHIVDQDGNSHLSMIR